MYIHFDRTKPKDVVALGRATVDLYANEVGPMEDAQTFSKYVGGSPANTSVAMVRLGMKVGYIGKVSDDQFGRFIVRFLSKEGIDTSHIAVAAQGIRSGVTMGEILKDKCNCFMYRNDCADIHILPTELDEDYIGSHKLLLISGTSLSHSPARESVFLAMEMAHRNGTVIAIDLDYRDGTWDNQEETSIYLHLASEKADIVIGTRDEFDAMEYLYHAGNNENPKSAAWLLKKGVKIVVIKNGKKGSLVFTENKQYRGGIYPTEVLKSFGAGDAYSSAFNYGLLHDLTIEEALKYAAAASSITITGHSCSDAMPSLLAVQNYVATHQYII